MAIHRVIVPIRKVSDDANPASGNATTATLAADIITQRPLTVISKDRRGIALAGLGTVAPTEPNPISSLVTSLAQSIQSFTGFNLTGTPAVNITGPMPGSVQTAANPALSQGQGGPPGTNQVSMQVLPVKKPNYMLWAVGGIAVLGAAYFLLRRK